MVPRRTARPVPSRIILRDPTRTRVPVSCTRVCPTRVRVCMCTGARGASHTPGVRSRLRNVKESCGSKPHRPPEWNRVSPVIRRRESEQGSNPPGDSVGSILTPTFGWGCWDGSRGRGPSKDLRRHRGLRSPLGSEGESGSWTLGTIPFLYREHGLVLLPVHDPFGCAPPRLR